MIRGYSHGPEKPGGSGKGREDTQGREDTKPEVFQKQNSTWELKLLAILGHSR